MSDLLPLTRRQQSELEYHRKHAEGRAGLANQPPSLDVVQNARRRWWNAYWSTYSLVRALSPRPRRALVVGCGFGEDAFRVAALAEHVDGFDLSPESVAIARARLRLMSGLAPVEFQTMPSEALSYPSNTYDLILAVDILHHVDSPQTIRELHRVAADGCRVICDEVYTHSSLEAIRRSVLVDRGLYPRLRSWIYGRKAPYITPDERKLSEADVAQLRDWLRGFEARYYNAVVGRLAPDSYDTIARIDRAVLAAIGPLARLFGARVVMSGTVRKPPAQSPHERVTR
jgi:ubiquinone/menaquinone biosynthesis C-methylase UbiE